MHFSFKKIKFPSKKTLFYILFALYFAIILPVFFINTTLVLKRAFKSEAYPTFCGYLPVVIDSEDMGPALKSGDLAVFKNTDVSKIAKGDIICYTTVIDDATSITIRRVSDRYDDPHDTTFAVKSEQSDIVDPLVVYPHNILGVYSFRIPNMGNAVVFIQGAAGFVLFVILPLVSFFVYDFVSSSDIDFKRYFKSIFTKLHNIFNKIILKLRVKK